MASQLTGALVDITTGFASAAKFHGLTCNFASLGAATVYYKMRGMDQATNGLYDTWVVYGTPDFSATQYAGSLATPLRDVAIDASWSA